MKEIYVIRVVLLKYRICICLENFDIFKGKDLLIKRLYFLNDFEDNGY